MDVFFSRLYDRGICPLEAMKCKCMTLLWKLNVPFFLFTERKRHSFSLLFSQLTKTSFVKSSTVKKQEASCGWNCSSVQKQQPSYSIISSNKPAQVASIEWASFPGKPTWGYFRTFSRRCGVGATVGCWHGLWVVEWFSKNSWWTGLLNMKCNLMHWRVN